MFWETVTVQACRSQKVRSFRDAVAEAIAIPAYRLSLIAGARRLTDDYVTLQSCGVPPTLALSAIVAPESKLKEAQYLVQPLVRANLVSEIVAASADMYLRLAFQQVRCAKTEIRVGRTEAEAAKDAEARAAEQLSALAVQQKQLRLHALRTGEEARSWVQGSMARCRHSLPLPCPTHGEAALRTTCGGEAARRDCQACRRLYREMTHYLRAGEAVPRPASMRALGRPLLLARRTET